MVNVIYLGMDVKRVKEPRYAQTSLISVTRGGLIDLDEYMDRINIADDENNEINRVYYVNAFHHSEEVEIRINRIIEEYPRSLFRADLCAKKRSNLQPTLSKILEVTRGLIVKRNQKV
jgi:hypothetical protein